MKIIPVIVGATASGKTKLAEDIYKKGFFDYIIFADSRKVYKDMTIASSAPSEEFRRNIPCYMIGFLEPNILYSASKYSMNVNKIIMKNTGKPFIVGGSGLYLKAFFQGLFEVEPINKKVKDMVEKKVKEEGLGKVYSELKNIDPEVCKQIHENDEVRIKRALEVFCQTGENISSLWKKKVIETEFTPVYVGIRYPREILKKRIKDRVYKMFKKGLINESKNIIKKHGESSLAIRTIGYNIVNRYIENKISFEDTVNEIYYKTWQYARKQIAWFKRMKINWIDGLDNNLPDSAIKIWRTNGL